MLPGGVIRFVRCRSLVVPTLISCCLVNRYLSLAQAQSKAFVVDWTDPINKPVTPSFIGTKAFAAFPIEDVLEYIDWNPFFQVSLGHWPLWGKVGVGGQGLLSQAHLRMDTTQRLACST